MVRDAELDRLKTAQDHAFHRKQDAWQSQDHAWKRRSNARDASEKAFQAKQSAYSTQQTAWEYFQQTRSRNDPRIEQLNAQQETAFQNMGHSFAEASSAHDRHEGAAARTYADQGHRYKNESQGFVAERRRLVAENKSARASHDATQPAFQQAKERFAECKREHDQAKSEHEHTQASFKDAKANFDSAVRAFQARLDFVKTQSKQCKDDKRALAEKAGVPYQYRDNVYVSRQPSGTVNIYFGGLGAPDGFGHGHYAMDDSGKVTYSRDPMDQHGAQNFTEPQYWRKMKMDFDRDSGTFQSSNYFGIIGEKNQKAKAHIAINPDGEIVHVRDIGGEVLYDRKSGKGHLPKDLDWSN